MTAPSEEEIRAAFARAWRARSTSISSYRPTIAVEWSDAWTHVGALVDSVYDIRDMRPSEATELDEATSTAIAALRERVTREFIDALVGVALRFGAAHPEAPRVDPVARSLEQGTIANGNVVSLLGWLGAEVERLRKPQPGDA
jgi:hypothetical protein